MKVAPDARSSSRPPLFLPRVLIANLRLGFPVNPVRINELKFSNRKFSPLLRSSSRNAISRVTPRPILPSLLATRHSSLATVFLIVTPELEFPLTATKQTLRAFSNRYKTPFSNLRFASSSATASNSELLASSLQKLIANPRSGIPASGCNEKTEAKSNRERMAIFLCARAYGDFFRCRTG